MQKIIKDGAIQDCDLNWIQDQEQAIALLSSDAKANAIIPLTLWLDDEHDTSGVAGIWIDGTESTDPLTDKDLSSLAVIGLNFLAFADGRSFSYARLLRERLNYQGEVRALGNFIPDQLGYLLRVGFNSFQFNETVDIEKALLLHKPFSVAYQGDVADPRPVFGRR
jgi:uncharacterized protein (DUF934 family)